MSKGAPIRIEENTIMKVLKTVKDGTATVVKNTSFSHPKISDDGQYCDESHSGIVEFVIDRKWRIFVFIDCGVWDYIDSVAHGGKYLSNGILSQFYPVINKYVPSPDIAQEHYGIEEIRSNVQHTSKSERKRLLK